MAAVVFGSDKTRGAAMDDDEAADQTSEAGKSQICRAMDKAAAAATEGIYDVYLHCYSNSSHPVWYRVKFGDDKEEEKEKLKPVARIPLSYNHEGCNSWTFVGNDIYYTGKIVRRDDSIVSVIPVILKHTIHDHDHDESDLEEWEIECLNPPIPPWRPLFSADVANKKLYLVGGHTGLDLYGDLPDDTPCGCGLVYDLVAKTWTRLQDVHLRERISYYDPYEASVVFKGKGSNEAGPMEFAFFNLHSGTMLFLSVAQGGTSVKVLDSAVHDQLKLFPSSESESESEFDPPHTGLSDADFFSLQTISSCLPAVVIDRTMYWFSRDMCLYGYDSKAKTWIKSECLKNHFLKPYYMRYDNQMPLLLGLPESKMLVILPTSDDEFTITLLEVVADKTVTTSLSVLVGATQGYCFDYPCVMVTGGMAI